MKEKNNPFTCYNRNKLPKILHEPREVLIKRRLNDCGHFKTVFCCEGCGGQKHIFQKCGIRMCPKCEKYRWYRQKKRLKPLFESMKNPKLLTLTWQGHTDNYKEKRARCDKDVRNFIRVFKMNGLLCYEVVPKKDGYYIHAHLIIDSKFIAIKRISEKWKKITKTSYRVDIRRITNSIAINYVLKYTTKVNIKISLDDYAYLFYKSRFLTRFGKFYNMKINIKERFENSDFWRCKDCGGYFRYLTVLDDREIISTY